jgi:hypothetical protein
MYVARARENRSERSTNFNARRHAIAPAGQPIRFRAIVRAAIVVVAAAGSANA